LISHGGNAGGLTAENAENAEKREMETNKWFLRREKCPWRSGKECRAIRRTTGKLGGCSPDDPTRCAIVYWVAGGGERRKTKDERRLSIGGKEK